MKFFRHRYVARPVIPSLPAAGREPQATTEGSDLDGRNLLLLQVSPSSQNRSLRYFAAESAKTVTITAGSSTGIRLATCKQPFSAAAALGLTSKPSSRASRFTMRYDSSVDTSRISSASVSS